MEEVIRSTTYNSTFEVGEASCFAYRFVVTESPVLGIDVCAQKPAHRKSANRFFQCHGGTPNLKLDVKNEHLQNCKLLMT